MNPELVPYLTPCLSQNHLRSQTNLPEPDSTPSLAFRGAYMTCKSGDEASYYTSLAWGAMVGGGGWGVDCLIITN